LKKGDKNDKQKDNGASSANLAVKIGKALTLNQLKEIIQ
jgi:hypothetical protein